ncbi:MAG TPA: cytochrome c-type biogenesis protein CcmH, partial [Gemmatimonadaceae bacterium]|nr:cytochrome c-type biogenesis protein CcmH [Gemmatimonadaceae bacterium]
MTGVPSRRRFVVALGGALASAFAGPRLSGQQAAPQAGVPGGQSSVSNVAMDPGAYREVKRPPKVGAPRIVSDLERDALERTLACVCPCTLDVFTCRTTDFSCGISPAMHGDVQALVEGGHSAREIVDAFVETYGEQVLMAPRARGFNNLAYVAPFAALGAGATLIAFLVRRWSA